MNIKDLLSEDKFELAHVSYPSPESERGEFMAHPEKRFPCTEPFCNKSFTRRYNLSAHLRCHRSEKPFECSECPMKFARKHDLARHKRSIHENIKSFGPCPYCRAMFARSDALNRHIKVEEARVKKTIPLYIPAGLGESNPECKINM